MTAVGVDSSAKLSGFLALGSLSPRMIHAAALRYAAAEAGPGGAAPDPWAEPRAGDSWRWLLMHLAIRDWFLFSALRDGDGAAAAHAVRLLRTLSMQRSTPLPCPARSPGAARGHRRPPSRVAPRRGGGCGVRPLGTRPGGVRVPGGAHPRAAASPLGGPRPSPAVLPAADGPAICRRQHARAGGHRRAGQAMGSRAAERCLLLCIQQQAPTPALPTARRSPSCCASLLQAI